MDDKINTTFWQMGISKVTNKSDPFKSFKRKFLQTGEIISSKWVGHPDKAGVKDGSLKVIVVSIF